LQLFVYTRPSLIPAHPPPQAPVLLLEGSWPTDAAHAEQTGHASDVGWGDDAAWVERSAPHLRPADSGATAGLSSSAPDTVGQANRGTLRWSLERAIDGRFLWIDQQAAAWAEQLADQDHRAATAAGRPEHVSPLDLNALDLRYWLVKAIRTVAYFTEVRPLCHGQQIELVAERPRDRDYAEILRELCRLTGAQCLVRWVDAASPADPRFPPNFRARRWAAVGLQWLQGQDRPSSHPRIVLCGNPRLLDPVCGALVERGIRPWWLYDRFALRSWLRWIARGARQLVCASAQSDATCPCAHLPPQLDCRGVNLVPALAHWLDRRLATHGKRQARALERIDTHFRRVRPDVLVLTEDATWFSRAAISAARRHGARSVVIQHGAPCCRFGFAPLAADRILVWGPSSRDQLLRWGVPSERIAVTGSPDHDRLRARFRQIVPRPGDSKAGRPADGRPQVLLLATIPPRDDRPDAVALQLTSHTYAELLHAAFAAVAATPGSRMTVKLHPRSDDDPSLRTAMGAYPSLGVRLVRGGDLAAMVSAADVVLSCGSSAGVDAMLSGVPVIQLLPPGARFLDDDSWGFFGTARTEADLRRLLAEALVAGHRAPAPDRRVFGNVDRPAVERIVEHVGSLADAGPALLVPKATGRSPWASASEEFSRLHSSSIS